MRFQSTLYPVLEWYYTTKQVISTRVQIQLLFGSTEHVRQVVQQVLQQVTWNKYMFQLTLQVL